MVDISFVKYLPRDKEALIQGKEYYSAILIEAPIALLKFKSLSQLLGRLGKPFAIDPSTYRFHPEFSEDEEKISIQQLKESYSIPQEESMMYPEIFTEEFAKSFVEKVVSFQNNLFLPSKQTVLLRRLSEDSPLRPTWIIPPYFPIEDFDDEWISINVQLAKYAEHFAGDKEIFPILSILDKDLLLQSEYDKVIKYLTELPGTMLGIWIADFDKRSISEDYLQAYKEFIEFIKQYRQKVVILYSNFFDILLQPYGISYGIFGGDVKYSSSGAGREYHKVYIPFLRREFTIETAVPVLSKYGVRFGYEKTQEILSIIRELLLLDKEYSELRKKGMTRNGFRISLLSDEEKSQYKELGGKIGQLKTQLKLEFLKERNKECKIDIHKEIESLEKIIDNIMESEPSKAISRKYVGHLQRWVQVIQG
ncbi:hypothetical protein [Thermococcus sp.]